MAENRVQFNNIVQNQLPQYVREEYPLIEEFLKQYYNAFGEDKKLQHKSKIQYNQIHNWNGKMNSDEAKVFRGVRRRYG